jgi:hypothetical protein
VAQSRGAFGFLEGTVDRPSISSSKGRPSLETCRIAAD